MFQAKKDNKEELLLKKEWYIIVDNRQEGPFSLMDLRRDPRFTPDTLTWKKNFKEWIAARYVPEMREVFADEVIRKPPLKPAIPKGLDSDLGQESQATLTLQQDPSQMILWILVILLIFLYTYFQLADK